jgi:hypothetical protein
MPSTIPYDPSLVLGNIVTKQKLDIVTAISAAQAPADAAEDTLNSLISLKRSIDMTVQELIEMNIDATSLIGESQEAGKQITAAAVDYGKAKIAAEKAIQPLKAKIRTVSDSIESPVDYTRTQTKTMPLAADSMKMNCQYFAYDENKQDSASHAATVAGFVADSVSAGGFGFSESFSSEAKTSVQRQMSSQHQRHSISGTLVVTITCTHKDALLLAPFILDPDKAVRIWNAVFPDDEIKTNSVANILQILAKQDTKQEKSLSILSGQTSGSCFIGMVHTLNTTLTSSSEQLYSVAESLQAQFSVANWFENESGGFGVSSSFSSDAKNLLSTQNVTSHCTLTVMGSIPSIKSSTVVMAVKAFDMNSDPMAAVTKVQNATASELDSIDSAASASRTGAQFQSMKASQIQAALSSLSDIDNQNNKIIDTNSLMDAMEDYINKCLSGNIGLPINYYIKPITKSQIAQLWLAKYYPSKLTQIGGGDDSAGSGGNASSAAPPPPPSN